MYSKITWITEINNCNIAISEKPKGNEFLSDEINKIKKSGIKLVVSLLRPNEIEKFEQNKKKTFV